MKAELRKRALELGFDACRVTTAAAPINRDAFERWIAAGKHGEMAYLARNAHKRIDPNEILDQARSIVVLAASYHSPESTPAARERTAGVVARYAQHDDYHDVLAKPLQELTNFVNKAGGEGARSLWYVDTGPLLERDLAQRAGLGFIGKHTNLISRELGNWFFLCEIITTAAIPPDKPEHNRCGTCSRCIPACPTEAIRAPFDLDARRCISYLTIELKGSIPEEFRSLIGTRIYGCDDCLAACPWNRFAKEGRLMKETRRNDLSTPDLVELLSLSPEQFKERFRGTPILRTKRRGVLRNVCVALGNVGEASALPPLRKASEDDEPLIREHAAWAIKQIEKRLHR